MPKERNKADSYREKAPIKREKSDVFIDSSERKQPRPKVKAKQGSWRISEATLLILAVIGGSIGALLGMQVWHHKTMHKGGVRDVDNIVEGTSSSMDSP